MANPDLPSWERSHLPYQGNFPFPQVGYVSFPGGYIVNCYISFWIVHKLDPKSWKFHKSEIWSQPFWHGCVRYEKKIRILTVFCEHHLFVEADHPEHQSGLLGSCGWWTLREREHFRRNAFFSGSVASCWEKLDTNWCRISSINSMMKFIRRSMSGLSPWKTFFWETWGRDQQPRNWRGCFSPPKQWMLLVVTVVGGGFQDFGMSTLGEMTPDLGIVLIQRWQKTVFSGMIEFPLLRGWNNSNV